MEIVANKNRTDSDLANRKHERWHFISAELTYRAARPVAEQNCALCKIITEERFDFNCSCFDHFIPFRTKETVITILKTRQDVKTTWEDLEREKSTVEDIFAVELDNNFNITYGNSKSEAKALKMVKDCNENELTAVQGLLEYGKQAIVLFKVLSIQEWSC